MAVCQHNPRKARKKCAEIQEDAAPHHHEDDEVEITDVRLVAVGASAV